MGNERRFRVLTIALVVAGTGMGALGWRFGGIGEVVLGVLAVALGLVLYSFVRRSPEAIRTSAESTRESLIVQLALVITLFVFLAYLGTMVSSVDSSAVFAVPTSPVLATGGLLLGGTFGGLLPILTRSGGHPGFVNTIGNALTAAVFLGLFLVEPPTSVVYATAYPASRTGVLWRGSRP
ncbi:hypothetical protein [Natronosalvus rutilus]|uniref:DUF8100 domain-containing protein n=1 Tax=Natronosalvus rutilus TaxID=2953753 RepID=A0A9E7NCW7_9EURY|nr:hypothetical protein [Natronosalvus rutilus]UTF55186.1 hypothetical protein NGM29_08035 [Natronosalvus rutilus]